MWDLEEQRPEFWAAQKQIEREAAFHGRLPSCVTETRPNCRFCPLDNEFICPIRCDPDYQSYLKYLTELYVKQERQRKERVKLLKSILKRHHMRMHWEYLAILALKEAPLGLFTSAQSIRTTLERNSDVFCMEKEGVFNIAKQIVSEENDE
jgi:hypothetical protein